MQFKIGFSFFPEKLTHLLLSISCEIQITSNCLISYNINRMRILAPSNSSGITCLVVFFFVIYNSYIKVSEELVIGMVKVNSCSTHSKLPETTSKLIGIVIIVVVIVVILLFLSFFFFFFITILII